MTSNEELDSQVNKLKEQLEEIRRERGILRSQLEKVQSETTEFQIKQIELESRLQIETHILDQTKKLLIESTMRERNLSIKTEEQSNQETETKKELQRQVESLEEQIADYKETEKNHRFTKAALEAEKERIRNSLDHEKDREQKLYVVIEQLLKKVFDPGKEETSSVKEQESNVYEQIIEDFRSMETDTQNDDKEELWIRLKAALQTAGLWEEFSELLDVNFAKESSQLERQEEPEDAALLDQEQETMNQHNIHLKPEKENDKQDDEVLENSHSDEQQFQPPLVASIDFGTSFCTWACSTAKSDQEKDNGEPSTALVTKKVPTTALIEPDGETLQAFGYDAEKIYKELAEKGQHKEHYYFLRFKMSLDKEKLTRDVMIEDIMGKILPAKKVVTLSIEYISKDLIELGKEQSGAAVTSKDFAWTFSVPATWSDAAKQFMREAASEAQPEAVNVSIALDMESASVFCQQTIETDKKSGAAEQISTFSPGTKYIIIDAGAGKIEMTVYEVVSSGKLHEVHTAMGHKMGGNEVNNGFKHILEDVFGKEVCERFLREETARYLDLWVEFEEKKKALRQDTSCTVAIQIPSALVALAEQEIGVELKNIIRTGKYASDIEVYGHELSFNYRLMASLFEKPIKETVAYVKVILDDMDDVKTIIMVGGFSASPILQNAIKLNFPEVEVINPDGDAVAAGTVIGLQNPKAIEQRVLKKTYGIRTCSTFRYFIHPWNKLVVADGVAYCKELFNKHVEKGQTITVGEVQKGETYTPILDDQTALQIILFASDEIDPMYVDDVGCSKIGEIMVDISDVPGQKQDRAVEVSLIFSETEIQVRARVEKTGKSVTGLCNFLG